MNNFKRFKTSVVGVGGLTLLLSAPIVSAQNYPDRDYRNNQVDVSVNSNRLSMTGRVTRVLPERDGYRVYLDRGSYSYWVPSSVMAGRDLRVGSDVRIGGIINGDLVTADVFAMPGDRYYASDPYYTESVRSNGWLNGTVVNSNHRLGYFDIRDDASGDVIRVDVRNANVRRSVNLWDIRRGDHINVRGAWERAGVFQARRVDY